MELPEANRIIFSVKAALAAEGYKTPPALETDGLMILLGRLDGEKALAARLDKVRGRAKKADNRLMLSDKAALRRAETVCLFLGGLMGYGRELTASPQSLASLNRALLSGLYDNAGSFRRTELVEGGAAHTSPQYIAGSVGHLTASMRAAEGAPRQSKADFAAILTHFMREMLILRPMARCSGVTQRLFFAGYAAGKGFSLQYGKIPPKALAQAEKHAFLTDDVQPLFKLLLSALTYGPARQKEVRRTVKPRVRQAEKTAPAGIGSPARPKAPTGAPFGPTPAPRPPKKEGDYAQSEAIAAAEAACAAAPGCGPFFGGVANDLSRAPDDVVKKAARLQRKIQRLTEAYDALVSPYLGDESPDKKD